MRWDLVILNTALAEHGRDAERERVLEAEGVLSALVRFIQSGEEAPK